MLDDIKPPVSKPRPDENKQPISHQPEVTAVPFELAAEKIPKQERAKRSFHVWPSHLSKKKQILIAVLIFLVTAGVIGTTVYFTFLKKPATTPSIVAPAKEPEPPKPTTVASTLTGVQVAPELNQRAITGVMIENSPDARPQAGLKDAGVVYEAVAEGGITRFLALFQESQPDRIGPVRSARPYYLDFLLPFDAAYAHVGGSPEALAEVKSLGVKDLDQFHNSGAYFRVKERFAPHNVYTSTAKLDELRNKKGFTTSTGATAFLRKAEAPSPTPTARTIDLTISSLLYNSHYDYDAATNSYKRSQAGKPHNDEAGPQLAPKVLVVLIMKKGIHSDGKHSVYTTTGSGSMLVFQDGLVTAGTWQKADRKAQFVFTDSAGAPLKLNPGQTWITALDKATAATYKP